MAVTDDAIAFALDLFSPLGDLTTRKMMGGLCLYHHGQIFAILGDSGQIYLKATGDLAQSLADVGSEIFAVTKKDGSQGTMGYWTLPDAAIDDAELACDWASKALKELA